MTTLFGKRNHREATMTIADLMNHTSSQQNISIEGVIISLDDIRGPYGKDQSYLQKGAIYDGTSSMTFSFFSPKQPVPLKKDAYVALEGETEKNKYTRGEWQLKVFAIEALEEAPPAVKKEVREDHASEKRIELQVFTGKTEKRGVSTEKDYIDQAIEMGHEAIAITDTGGVQAFPGAYNYAKGKDIKLLYGMTGKFIDMDPIVTNPDSRKIEDVTYVVVDVETTGLSTRFDDVIELGAARFTLGKDEDGNYTFTKLDEFNRLITTKQTLTPFITNLTGITNDMLTADGVDLTDAMEDFFTYMGDGVLVAHNAQFDRGHINKAFCRAGITPPAYALIDTMMLSRTVNTEYKRHGLGDLVKREKVKLENHHRATDDAIATGYVFFPMILKSLQQGITRLDQWNNLQTEDHYRYQHPFEATILVQNQEGLKNLYKIVTESHTKYLSSAGRIGSQGAQPVIPWHLFQKYRRGLLLGSGSHLGRVFEYALNKDPEDLRHVMQAHDYDYYEIQPTEVASHLWYEGGSAKSKEAVDAAWKTVYEEAKKLGKPVVATGHVHYTTRDLSIYHDILLYSALPPKQMSHDRRPGRMENPQGLCYYRNTEEMLDAFSWLDPLQRREVVIENPKGISDSIEEVVPIPDQLYTPEVPGKDSGVELRKIAQETLEKTYGSPAPAHLQERLDRELDSIISNGYAVVYYVSHLLVKKSNEDGYLVGSRGSIGSSFAATMTGITEVNPLEPHYRCSNCQYSVFFNDQEYVASGFDLPYSFASFFKGAYTSEAKRYFAERIAASLGTSLEETVHMMKHHKAHTCPKCQENTLVGDGQDIPFETFLGFKGDKVPDIDLNFSGVYQPTAHQFIYDMFKDEENEYVYRAGTIGTVAEKTAFASVRSYMNNNGRPVSNAEVVRMGLVLQGTKTTTGQHPGGMLVRPADMEIEEFTPVQYPANDPTSPFKTSHFEFEAIHDFILKFDILGHDMPTNLRLMQDLTGVDPRSIPGADPQVLKLWYDTEGALGVHHEEFLAKTGTLGLPEMATRVVQDVIAETKPTKYAELVNLSGLTHGTDVYYNNAQNLIQQGTATISEVIGCRDDIMRYLLRKGMDPSLSFQIMEAVRKGKGVREEWAKEMVSHGVPEWYIESCNKIRYMFPKAHAVAYVTDAIRMGWFKIHYPVEFYAAQFSARFSTVNVRELLKSPEDIKQRMGSIDGEVKKLEADGDQSPANQLKRLKTALNLALEAKVRGIQFGSIRLYESHANEYRIDPETKELIPPFSAIDGIGPKVATNLYEEAKVAPFIGVDDLQKRTGATETNVKFLRSIGCLQHVENIQHTFF